MLKNKKEKNQKLLGLLLATLGMVVYGLFPVYSHAIVSTLDPLIFGGITTFIGSLLLVGAVQAKGNQKYLFSNNKYLGRLLIIAVLTGIATLLFFVGTKLTSGINTSLLSQVEPMYAVILASLFLGEAVGLGAMSAIIVIVIGAGGVVFKGFTAPNIGDILILATPIFYQLSHVVSKKIIHELPDANIIPAARLFYGGLLLTIFGIILHPTALMPFFTLGNILFVLLFALIFRTLDMFLWYQALVRIPLSIASALIPVSLIISFTGSLVILKEIPTIQQYLGLFAMLFGLVWISFLHVKSSQ